MSEDFSNLPHPNALKDSTKLLRCSNCGSDRLNVRMFGHNHEYPIKDQRSMRITCKTCGKDEIF